MKIKYLHFLVLLLISWVSTAQGPIGNPIAYPWNSNPYNNQAWFRGGNWPGGAGGTNNIFGTFWNSPIYTYTNSINRTRLNGTLITPICNINTDVSGYFGIGPNGYFANQSPWSMLHLEGPNNTGGATGAGWRTWMRTGTFMKENSDAMYLGMQQQPGVNRSDAVINWSDDQSSPLGPDVLKIVFTGVAASGNGNPVSNPPLSGNSLQGYEFMRFASFAGQTNSVGFPVGHVGIGPVFTQAAPPQSRLHINAEDNLEVWFQISNENATGQTGTDGLRLGILGNGFAEIRQQENMPLIFLTDWDNISGGVVNGERMRITSVGQGLPLNPGGIYPDNTTRVAISHNGSAPITQPASLLHLGYNTGLNSFPPGSTDGWRPWMDIGMFVSSGTDNMYLGLISSGQDRQDAVVNWGDNQGVWPQQGLGPDNLLFVFTATQSGVSTAPANQPNGVEGMRMTPTENLIFTGIGGTPVINPYTTGDNPGQTLEVNSPAVTIGPLNSGLRFTDLNSTSATIVNPGTGVLSVDNNGDVIYVPGDPVGFGSLCSQAPLGIFHELPDDWRVGMGNHNLYFDNANPGIYNPTLTNNSILIGIPCGVNPLGKLDVLQDCGFNGSRGIHVLNRDDGLSPSVPAIGIMSRTNGIRTVSGWFQAVHPPTGDQYNALFVPKDGGSIRFGFPQPAAHTFYTLEIQGDVLLNGLVNPSDSVLKKNISAFSRGLDVIRNMNTYTYNFNGLAGYDTSKTYVGVIAEELASIAPYAVETFYEKLDTADSDLTALTGVRNEAIIYTAVNAIKELDSSFAGFTAPPSPPQLISPVNGTIADFCSGLEFVWHPVAAGLVLYSFQLARDSSFSDILHIQSFQTFDTSFKLRIRDTGNYYWRVSALNSGGISEFSGTFRFNDSTICGSPETSNITTEAAMAFITASDIHLKTNINPVTNSLDKVNAMTGITYNWDTAACPDYMIVDHKQQLGLIAQDVEPIVPEVVYTDSNGFKFIDYGRLVPVLIESIKELTNRVQALENQNNKSMQQPTGEVHQREVILQSQLVVLDQNNPNPFKETTTIHYYIPDHITYAQIIFTDISGRIIQTVDIHESGDGQLNVMAEKLSSGLYTYSIVADGIVVDSKKMVKE